MKGHAVINYDDLGRLEYGRLLWKRPDFRARLERHWTDERHPHAARFARFRDVISRVLNARSENDEALDKELRAEGWSLRAAMREIPPVFGHFWGDSRGATEKIAA